MDRKGNIRPDVVFASGLLSMAFIMLLCVVFYKITGEEGAGFLSAPVSLFVIAISVFIFAFESVTRDMVRARLHREQMLHAKKNVRQLMLASFITGCGFALVFALLSKVISVYVFHSPRNFMVILMMSPVFIFLSIQGVCRGYLSGAGYSFVSVISNCIMVVVTYICSLILSNIGYRYGLKVNALMHVDDIASAYGAVGAAIGISAGGFLSFLFILIVMFIKRHELRALEDGSAKVKNDYKNESVKELVIAVVLFGTFGLLLFIDECVYMNVAWRIHPTENNISSWGIYMAECIAVVSALVFLTAIPFVKSWFGVHVAIVKKDYKAARARLSKLVHFEAMLVMPVTVIIMILAKTLTTVLFGKSNDAAVNMIVLAITAILPGSAFLFQTFLLRKLKNYFVLLLNTCIGIVVHLVTLLVMSFGFNMGIHASIAAFIAMLLILSVVGWLELSLMLDYKQEFKKSLILPLLSSGIAGLLALLIDRIFVNMIGEILTALIAILLSYVSYMVLLIVFKSVDKYEVEKMPFGYNFAVLCDKLGDR